MPLDQIDPSYFSPDILEFLELLHAHEVRYVVVGGEAVIYYGHARLTGDIDFLYDAGDQNAAALFREVAPCANRNRPPRYTVVSDIANVSTVLLILGFHACNVPAPTVSMAAA